MLLVESVSAQSSGNGLPANILIGLVLLIVAGAFWALSTVISNLLSAKSKEMGVEESNSSSSLALSLRNFMVPKPKAVDSKSKVHYLDKGFELKMAGQPGSEIKKVQVYRVALKPIDFNFMSPIPKVDVEPGDKVKAGDVIFYDKKRPEIKYVAPVSGEIVDIVRGDKRAITHVVILCDQNMEYKKFEVPNIDTADRSSLMNFLAESGGLTLINQRPFDIVPSIEDEPENIFISTFDTAPLAPDNNFVVAGKEDDFQMGINVLAKLTSGSVFLGLDAMDENVSPAFRNAANAKIHWFAGKHPAGNVGVQIHHISPIRHGKNVWTLGVQDVIALGVLFNKGIFDASRLVAVAGHETIEQHYASVVMGASMGDILKNNLTENKFRIISGDVFSGKQSSLDDYLNYRDDQITVITEGDEYELFGWLLPIKLRPSTSGTFPNFLFPNHEYKPTTNTRGEKRAFVVSGQFEEVLPMDIYPQHLAKAILANDIEKMEGLGIYELTEEDIAICEFVCTSKSPLQSILREGLVYLKEQG
jgi:Na+-transporting NADH:ubiquinone oxidoreductase subunit A